MKKIDSFSGQYRFLSNFYPAEIRHHGINYPTVEHAYQAMKIPLISERMKIAQAASPGEAKRLGQNTELRHDWETLKEHFMSMFLRKKFLKHEELKQKLLDTGDAKLIEGNTWNDTYWGVCKGVGKNRLGILLMDLRSKIRSGCDT